MRFMGSSRLLLLGITLVATLSTAFSAPRRRTSDEVLLVTNADSPISVDVADDYAKKRHIHNRVTLHCEDSAVKTENETISLTDYIAQIEKPIRAYLSSHPGINFIVLTKGVPIRIVGASLGSCDEN